MSLDQKAQHRLAESERFGRVLVSLLQKTVLEQVLDMGYSNDLAVVLNAAGKVYEYYPYEGGGHNLNSPCFEPAMQKNDPDDPSFSQTSTDGSAAP